MSTAGVSDVACVQVNTYVGTLGDRRVLADPASQIEDGRAAIDNSPAAQERDSPAIQAEGDIQAHARALPDDRTVEDAGQASGKYGLHRSEVAEAAERSCLTLAYRRSAVTTEVARAPSATGAAAWTGSSMTG